MNYSTNYTSNGKHYLIIAEKENTYLNLYRDCDKIVLLVKLSEQGTPLSTVYVSACSNDRKTKYVPKTYPFATFQELENDAINNQTFTYKWLL